jgi:type III secretion protein J
MGLRGLPGSRTTGPVARWVVSAAAIVLVGCAVPVEVGLDDAEANRVFLALDRAGVDAMKEQDPGADGRWRISVAREDVARALAAMKDAALPRAETERVEPSKGALVPSEAAERAQILAATAQGLQASLESIDGVLRARVHLAGPEAGGGLLRDTAQPYMRGSASVLFEYRGATPPVSADAVQRLVAGAIAGLAATDVTVVMVPVTAPAPPQEGVLAHVGPIAVARSSKGRLQVALVSLLALAGALTAAALLLYVRLGRARALAALAGAQADADETQDSGPRKHAQQAGSLRRGAS